MNDPIAKELTGSIPFILSVSAILTLPISLALLRIYRRAVIRSMGNTVEAATSIVETAEEAFFTPATKSIITADSSATLYNQLQQSPWKLVAIYTLSGLGYATVMTLAIQLADRNPYSPLQFICVIWLYLWPTVITLNLVAASTKQVLWRSHLVYFGGLIALGSIAQWLSNSNFSWIEIMVLWAIFNLPTTLLLLAFMHPKVRSVGPLILITVVFSMTGFVIFHIFVTHQDSWLRAISTVSVLLGLNAVTAFLGTVLVSILLGILVFAPFGWMMLQWIRKRYEQKHTSEQSLLLVAIWALFALVNSIGLVSSSSSRWSLSGCVAFLVFLGISNSLLNKVNRPTTHDGRGVNLLLLRVFALGSRSEQLFRALSLHWRYIGSIQMIAGPDLVNTTIEPHEFLDFVTGKLARRFIDSPQTLERRLKEMDLQRDRDHRYRVNDFFCYNNTWKLTLISLLKTSDTILMDLRSFTPQRAGCIFEINTLISLVPLEKIVLLVDKTTDDAFLQATLNTAWQVKPTTSPNTTKSLKQLQIFQFQSTSEQLSSLLKILIGASYP